MAARIGGGGRYERRYEEEVIEFSEHLNLEGRIEESRMNWKS